MVAIQPYSQLIEIDGVQTDQNLVSGYIYYDPLDTSQKKFHPSRASPLIFLLNSLSFYHDLILPKKLSEFPIPLTPKDIIRIGGQGPFGISIHTDDTPITTKLNQISLLM